MRIADRARGVTPPPIVAFKDTLRDLLAREDVVDLSQAVPSYPPPPPVLAAIADAGSQAAAARYTTDPGLPAARAAIADDLQRRHGGRVDGDHLLITPGANAGFHFVINVLFDPGETVTLVSPYYFNHAMSVELLGGRVAELRLGLDRSLADQLAAGRLDVVPAGGVLVLVHPGNPTGHCLTAPDLTALFDWARDRDVRLVLDETYLEFHPRDLDPVTGLAVERWWDTAVVIGSFSKSLAVTGYRIGYVAAAPDLLDELLKVQDAAVVCAPHPGQLAVLAGLAWERLDDWLAANREEIDRRVAAFGAALAATDGPFTLESAGAFFAWVETPAAPPASTTSRQLEPGWQLASHLADAAGVVCLPGTAFGREEVSRLRIAVGNAEVDRLRLAARRIQEAGLPPA